jgi:hypothetical protein
MTMPLIISVLAGMAVGLRFKVFMNIPVIVAAVLATAAIAIAQGEHSWAILSAIALSAFGVQIGYLCGTFAYSIKETPAPAASPSPSVPADAFRTQTGMRIPVQYSDR